MRPSLSKRHGLKLLLLAICLLGIFVSIASGFSWVTTGTAAFWRNPSPPEGAKQAVVIILRPGADPLAVADRIAGPNAYLRRGGQDQSGRWWFSIPIAPGHEWAALQAAQSEQTVSEAFLVDWPSDRRM